MFDLSFLSQSMWDIYSTCAGAATGHFNRTAYESLVGVSFQSLLQNAEGFLQYSDDPKKQLMEDYYAWKAQQPQRYLPDSKGDTQENRDYLRRHFSGQLSVMERIYALDTMREMGMITQQEMLETIGVGNGLSVISMDDPVIFCQPARLDPTISKWNEFFRHANISRCPTLDKLFSMSATIRETIQVREAAKQQREQQTAAQEVASTLNALTARKAS